MMRGEGDEILMPSNTLFHRIEEEISLKENIDITIKERECLLKRLRGMILPVDCDNFKLEKDSIIWKNQIQRLFLGIHNASLRVIEAFLAACQTKAERDCVEWNFKGENYFCKMLQDLEFLCIRTSSLHELIMSSKDVMNIYSKNCAIKWKRNPFLLPLDIDELNQYFNRNRISVSANSYRAQCRKMENICWPVDLKRVRRATEFILFEEKNHNYFQSFTDRSDDYNDGNRGDDYKKDNITLSQVDVLQYQKEKYEGSKQAIQKLSNFSDSTKCYLSERHSDSNFTESSTFADLSGGNDYKVPCLQSKINGHLLKTIDENNIGGMSSNNHLCTKKRKQKKHAQISEDLDHNKSLKYNAVKILLAEAKVEKDEIIVDSLKPDEVEKKQNEMVPFPTTITVNVSEKSCSVSVFEGNATECLSVGDRVRVGHPTFSYDYIISSDPKNKLDREIFYLTKPYDHSPITRNYTPSDENPLIQLCPSSLSKPDYSLTDEKKSVSKF